MGMFAPEYKKADSEICADSWCCNGTNRSGSARYYQHYQAEKSICADPSVSGHWYRGMARLKVWYGESVHWRKQRLM